MSQKKILWNYATRHDNLSARNSSDARTKNDRYSVYFYILSRTTSAFSLRWARGEKSEPSTVSSSPRFKGILYYIAWYIDFSCVLSIHIDFSPVRIPVCRDIAFWFCAYCKNPPCPFSLQGYITPFVIYDSCTLNQHIIEASSGPKSMLGVPRPRRHWGYESWPPEGKKEQNVQMIYFNDIIRRGSRLPTGMTMQVNGFSLQWRVMPA